MHSRDDQLQLVMRDVTARRRAEAQLRESEERLALAVAGAREGVWDLNLVTGHVLYSPRWKQMLGYEDERDRAAHPGVPAARPSRRSTPRGRGTEQRRER